MPEGNNFVHLLFMGSNSAPGFTELVKSEVTVLREQCILKAIVVRPAMLFCSVLCLVLCAELQVRDVKGQSLSSEAQAAVTVDQPESSLLSGNFSGEWHGDSLPAQLEIKITKKANDLAATAYVSLWGETRWSIDELHIDGEGGSGVIQHGRTRVSISFRIAEELLSGSWRAGKRSGRFSAKRVAAFDPREALRPQTPLQPSPHYSEEVTIQRGASRLSGEFMRPNKLMAYPAVLLIPGSSAWDRDYSSFGHEYFHVIADQFARAGIATLRLDDRGIGGSSGEKNSCTTEQLADDAAAAVDFLAGRTDVDRRRISVLGHSLGAVIALCVPERTKQANSLLLLSCPMKNGAEVILDFDRSNCEKKEMSPQAINDRQKLLRIVMQSVILSESRAEAVDRALRDAAPLFERYGRNEVRDLIGGLMQDYYNNKNRSNFKLDPEKLARESRVPTLCLFGDFDLVVTAGHAAIAAKIRQDVKGFEVVRLPKHNHSLQTLKTGEQTESQDVRETISEVALDAMTTWIAAVKVQPRHDLDRP